MDGIQSESTSENTLILNNQGIINIIPSTTSTHISTTKTKILIQNYKIKIDESATEFNKFKGGDSVSSEASKNSHLMISIVGGKIEFKDINSKIILAFGEKFSFGEKYFISKLVTGTSGEKDTNLNVDFSRLELGDKDLYTLTQSGDDAFIVNLIGGGGGGNGGGNIIVLHTPITAIYKANIRTMNNFMTMSNSMIYPRKHYKSQNLGRKNSKNILSLRDLPTANRGNLLALSSLRADSQNLRGNPHIKKSLDSANSLKSYESFAYQNESQNPQTRRIQRQNKRNYSRNVKDSSLRADSQNLRGNLQNQRFSQNLAQNPHDYYFILTPFINHNLFFESGRYNLSGFDGGFLTAFSAQFAESNSLGAHFMMSYGSLGNSHDKNFHISNLNLNLGVNYKLDLVYDMYLKARGDFFYFLNQVKTLAMREAIKSNNLGFGVSVSYGKDFDFKQGGVLGLEVGLDYKALKTNEVLLNSQTYKQSLYNLIYADLGLNYQKYFGGFGLTLGGGFKANLAPNLAKVILLVNSQNLRFVLDNDKYLGYANAGVSYVLNARNFDMEFSLAYYGNFGDRVISNGGGFEWRVGW